MRYLTTLLSNNMRLKGFRIDDDTNGIFYQLCPHKPENDWWSMAFSLWLSKYGESKRRNVANIQVFMSRYKNRYFKPEVIRHTHSMIMLRDKSVREVIRQANEIAVSTIAKFRLLPQPDKEPDVVLEPWLKYDTTVEDMYKKLGEDL